MGAREPVDQHWQQVHRSLLSKIAYRERELLELHQDYLALEKRYKAAREWAKLYWRQRDIERANREANGPL